MPRPRNITDEQILVEARRCFLESGAGVSTQAIATRLGVSHAVLFQRFGTKEQLMRAALTPAASQPWLERLKAGPDKRALDVQLTELADEIYAFIDQMLPCVAILRSAGLYPETMDDRPQNRPPVRARREVIAWFDRAVAQRRMRKVKTDHVADLFLGALQTRPFMRHVAGKVHTRADTRAYVEFAVGVLWNWLKPGGGKS